MKRRIFVLIYSITFVLLISCSSTQNKTDSTFLSHSQISEQDLYTLIEKNISFEYNENIFSAYAFANYTGFDFDNLQYYSNARRMVRDDLAIIKPNISNKRFYSLNEETFNNGGLAWSAIKLGPPPKFQIRRDASKNEILLSRPLSEFYQKANIKDLYQKYEPYYKNIIAGYSDSSIIALAELYHYLRLNPNNMSEMIVIPNLLESNQRSLTFTINGKAILITGPWSDKSSVNDKANVTSVVHEYSHHFINPMIDKSIAAKRLSKRMSDKYGAINVQTYNTWNIFIKECFVRALSFIPEEVSDQAEKRISIDSRNGFFLERYIYERIVNEYLDYEGDFSSFCDKIMSEYIS